MKDIAEQAKDSMGLITMRVADDDEVAGFAPIGSDDDYIIMISDKGMTKKVSIKYFGGPARRGSLKDQGYMMTLDPTDTMRFVSGMREGQDVAVAMRNSVIFLNGNDIPDQTKKSKGKKMLSPSGNINIVAASVVDGK
jgi:DNA gyrase/topoisomerase IV subunit A